MTQKRNFNLNDQTLYIGIELSQSKWHLAFGDGQKVRNKVMEAKNKQAFLEALEWAKDKFGFAKDVDVISCYEAGRDGHWVHRFLKKNGIKNYVINPSSLKVSQHAKRRKTDKLDAKMLLRELIVYEWGDKARFDVIREISEQAEDGRRLHRMRERLIKERGGHTNRIRSLLNLHGIDSKTRNKGQSWGSYVTEVKDWEGKPLPCNLLLELQTEIERLELVNTQINALESQQKRMIKEDVALEPIIQLVSLKGVGRISAWNIFMEWFGWRSFSNGKEVGAAAGLVGSPYSSGNSSKEQGISKAGNHRIRALMVELAWSWLRYQPNSDLSKWFHERFDKGKRLRKIGIVALARKLLIALWRYITQGVVPNGAEFKKKIVL